MISLNNDLKFDFKDITIVPSITSSIRSRTQITSSHSEQLNNGNWINKLPLIVSPMDTVVDLNNYDIYALNSMLTCLPRGVNITNPKEGTENFIFHSYGLEEIKELIDKEYNFGRNVLIDIANGHMSELINVIKKFKSIYKSHKLMVGNIANPESYKVLSEAGADYIRCGIGGGHGCLTSEMTAIHYPMASLISEIFFIKKTLINENRNTAFIVADGGFSDYSDIIKALAIGADYVMLGSALNKCIESAGDNYFHGIKISKFIAKFLWNHGFSVSKKFRGMSTKEVQKKWGKTSYRASEGVIRHRPVEYNLKGWLRNFDDYLRSCMSYTNCETLDKFIGKPQFVKITDKAFKRFNK